MWKIKQLKERGKSCFQRNYWRAVLVALVISFIGGMPGSKAIKSTFVFAVEFCTNLADEAHARSFNDNDIDFGYDFDFEDGYNFNPYGGYGNHDQDIISDFSSRLNGYAIGVIIAVAILIFFLLMVVLIIRLLMDIFLFNPLYVGTQRFFIHNLSEQGMVGDMGFGFDRNYRNQVKVMFARDLYTFAWSLLFLIPGIYKSYEYRMIPYLMAEYPNMTKDQAFYTSKFLMKGNKWHAFTMDLSFIGWWILSAFTCGLVGLFYVNPYYISTCAALYEALKMIKGIPAVNNENPAGQQTVEPQTNQQTAPQPQPRPSQPVEGEGFVMHDVESNEDNISQGDDNEEN